MFTKFTTFIERSLPDGHEPEENPVKRFEIQRAKGFRGAVRELCAACRLAKPCAECVFGEYGFPRGGGAAA